MTLLVLFNRSTSTAVYVDLVGYLNITGTTDVRAAGSLLLPYGTRLRPVLVGESSPAALLAAAVGAAQAAALLNGAAGGVGRTHPAPVGGASGGTDYTVTAPLAGAPGGYAGPGAMRAAARVGLSGTPRALVAVHTGVGGPASGS